MAWYSDEQYAMIQDCKEKKSIAASAFKQRTHCGKCGGVRLPSDFMSKKELKAMNSAVEEFNLRKPMSWEKFKNMPDDLKVQYIKWIREYYGAPDKYIAEMMNCCSRTLQLYLKDINCTAGKGSSGGHRKWEKESFLAWCAGVDAKTSKELVSGLADVEETVEESFDDSVEPMAMPEIGDDPIVNSGPIAFTGNQIPVIPYSGSMTFQNNRAEDILTTLKTILGDIRVTMTINWEITE